MSELAVLIRDENARGVSYERMAARARRDRKLTISGSYLHQIARGRVRVPRAEMVPAIAASLGLGETQVKEAIARGANLHVEHGVDYQTGRLLSRVETMSPYSRDLWLKLSEAIAEQLIQAEVTGGNQTALLSYGSEPVAASSLRAAQVELDRETDEAAKELARRKQQTTDE